MSFVTRTFTDGGVAVVEVLRPGTREDVLVRLEVFPEKERCFAVNVVTRDEHGIDRVVEGFLVKR